MVDKAFEPVRDAEGKPVLTSADFQFDGVAITVLDAKGQSLSPGEKIVKSHLFEIKAKGVDPLLVTKVEIGYPVLPRPTEGLQKLNIILDLDYAASELQLLVPGLLIDEWGRLECMTKVRPVVRIWSHVKRGE